jgi:hypothetical protein
MTTTTTHTKENDAAIRQRMTSFSGYKTSDDILHETEDAAFKHEKTLDRRDKLSDFCARHGHRGMDCSEVADMLVEHADELLKILQ